MKRKSLYLVIFAIAAAGAGTGSWLANRTPAPPAPAQAEPQKPTAPPSVDVSAISLELRGMLDAYRKIIVLTHDDAAQGAAERAQANRIGQQLFHENQERSSKIDAALTTVIVSQNPRRFDAIGTLLDYVESGEGLYDAHRLAFAK